jgi:hypothetical protein
MFGSAVNDKFGLQAASLALRHGEVAITASHYVSKRDGVVSGLRAVLAPAGENCRSPETNKKQRPPVGSADPLSEPIRELVDS